MVDQITHAVILNIDQNSYLGDLFLYMWAHRIVSDEGNVLICLWCSEVKTDNNIYLEVVAHKLEGENKIPGNGIPLRIPHQLVALIDGSYDVMRRIHGFRQEADEK
jgi:hypothetical protein